jgi:hypothetical protein
VEGTELLDTTRGAAGADKRRMAARGPTEGLCTAAGAGARSRAQSAPTPKGAHFGVLTDCSAAGALTRKRRGDGAERCLADMHRHRGYVSFAGIQCPGTFRDGMSAPILKEMRQPPRPNLAL